MEPCPELSSYTAETDENIPWCSEDDGTGWSLLGEAPPKLACGVQQTHPQALGCEVIPTPVMAIGVYGRSNGKTAHC